MGIIEIAVFGIFVRSAGIYGVNHVSEKFVRSLLPCNKSVKKFDPEYFEKRLMKTGLFSSVSVKYIGTDTIDLIVAVKEKRRFHFLPITDITPNNRIASGFILEDRFFMKRYEMSLKILTFNMKSIEFALKDYTTLWALKAGFEDAIYTDSRNVRTGKLLIGIADDKFKIFWGPVMIRDTFEQTVMHIDFSWKLRARHWIKLNFDAYPEGIYFSSDINLIHRLPTRWFILIPGFRLIFQRGYIPDYRMVVAGGYGTMISYPFRSSTGNSGYFFKFDLMRPIIPEGDKSPGVNIVGFMESGNTFNEFKDAVTRSPLLGAGIALILKFRETGSIGVYFTYNLEGRTSYGLYLQRSPEH